MSAVVEEVVLLDDAGRAVGTADKAQVHHASTPLHLAFSCYLFTPDGRLLLTRRAADKLTFPGVWTNSVCGHPGPGEALHRAVERRAALELGAAVADLRLVLPGFGYRAEQGGIVEHELCPVLVGTLPEGARLAPDPTEVDGVDWVHWSPFVADVVAGRRAISPWASEQVALLDALGPLPSAWPTADDDLLPPAARPSAA